MYLSPNSPQTPPWLSYTRIIYLCIFYSANVFEHFCIIIIDIFFLNYVHKKLLFNFKTEVIFFS